MLFRIVLVYVCISLCYSRNSTVPTCLNSTIYKYPIPDPSVCSIHRDNVYFHSLYDFKRKSSFPLFVNHICHALSLCIPPSNFRIIIHTLNPIESVSTDANEISKFDPIVNALLFLNQYDIESLKWNKVFNTVSARNARREVLRDVNQPNQIVYYVDADEFPIFHNFSALVDKLSSPNIDRYTGQQMLIPSTRKQYHNRTHYRMPQPKCDYIMGMLNERVSIDGSLVNIELPSNAVNAYSNATTWDINFKSHFPFQCKLKQAVESAMSTKLILFRALYRPLIGNHKLVCQNSASKSGAKKDNRKSYRACVQEQINNGQHMPDMAMFSRKPISCKVDTKPQVLQVDHYKYTDGIVEYLSNRVKEFKRIGLPWYKESEDMLRYLDAHDSKICVDCKESHCTKE